MKKIIAFGFLFIFLISFTYARECLDRIQASTDCIILTPAGYNCSLTYDIIQTNGTIRVDDGSLGTISSGTGVCNLTFNQPSGSYIIYLNEDNASRILVVDENTNEDFNSNLTSIREDISIVETAITNLRNNQSSNFSTIRNDLIVIDNEVGATNAGIESNKTYSEANLSTVRSTITSMDSELDSVRAGIITNTSYTEGNVSTIRIQLDTITSNNTGLLTNISELSAYMKDETSAGFFYKLFKTAFTWFFGGGKDLEYVLNDTTKMQNYSVVYYNNSEGYPQYEIYTYDDGHIVNKSYGYYADNMTIKNATEVKK